MASTQLGFDEATRQTIQMAVYDRNYKHGAFKGVIPKNASALEGLNILLTSPLLSESEKEKASRTRDVIISYEKDKWANLSTQEVMLKTLPAMDFTDIFEDDMKKRGEYVPPMLMQGYDAATGNVTSTHTVDSMGNAQSMAGGVPGGVPGAPADFNIESIKHMKDMGFGPRQAKNDQADTGAGSKENARNGAKGEDKAKFGSAFERNIRNAFI